MCRACVSRMRRRRSGELFKREGLVSEAGGSPLTTELISFEFTGDSILDPATRKKYEVIEGIEVMQLLALGLPSSPHETTSSPRS
jgi:hypothetical protein